MASTHSGRLERWLGREAVVELSHAMRGWYGPPIALAGVPGNVLVGGDGDFSGEIRAGWEVTARDRAWDLAKRFRRAARIATGPAARNKLNSGFATLSDLIAEAKGKRRDFPFDKVGNTVVGQGETFSYWARGNVPAAGSAPGNAPGGTAFTSASTGAYPFTNPGSGDTQHFVHGHITSTAQCTVLLYDLLFGVNKTMNSTATEAVTGVPTRYQSIAGSGADSIRGNFLFVQVGSTSLAATAHNWTVCTYTDQGGNASTLPSLTGISSQSTHELDHPVNQWFAPLATGDTGIQTLTQMQCSAAVATGEIWFMIGHPIAWMPCPLASVVCAVDGINTSFSLARIFDDACLAFLFVNSPASFTSPEVIGQFTTVSG